MGSIKELSIEQIVSDMRDAHSVLVITDYENPLGAGPKARHRAKAMLRKAEEELERRGREDILFTFIPPEPGAKRRGSMIHSI